MLLWTLLPSWAGAAMVWAVLVALAIDLLWGEPPARWHPVVWMGNWLGWAGRRVAPEAGTPNAEEHRTRPFIFGALAWCLGGGLAIALAWGIQAGLPHAVAALPTWLGVAVTGTLLGALLKPMLAWRMLRDEVLAVEVALGASLEAGRARLGGLVSRDVTQLDEHAVRESAIESLAENLNDSVIAPLCWFLLLGLPGAVLYRYANTADAMWGYRGVRGGRVWEWAGKWAAHVDDVLSWLPARWTAWLLCEGAASDAARPSWRAVRAQAALTASPNSGWPMSAMALMLGVALRKPGVYVLNDGGRLATPEDTLRARDLAQGVVFRHAVWIVAALALCFALFLLLEPLWHLALYAVFLAGEG